MVGCVMKFSGKGCCCNTVLLAWDVILHGTAVLAFHLLYSLGQKSCGELLSHSGFPCPVSLGCL